MNLNTDTILYNSPEFGKQFWFWWCNYEFWQEPNIDLWSWAGFALLVLEKKNSLDNSISEIHVTPLNELITSQSWTTLSCIIKA